MLRRISYVNRPEALLHVVGGKEVGSASELVEKVVFESEHGSGSDNGGLGIDGANHFFTPAL